MSLLKELIKEGGGGGGGGAGGGAGGGMGGGAAGATSAGNIAGGMFAGGANTSKRRKRATSQNVVGEKPAKPTPMIRRLTREGSLYGGGIINYTRMKKQNFRALQRAMSYIAEDITGSTDFDAADVVSKLDAAEKKAKLEKDTVTFGLENENGGLVRVYVRADQGDEFEQALSQMLANSDNNNDNENSSMEIAEVLFKLKDKFDIVDVNWGDIPEDEEQEQTVGGEGGAPAGGAAGGLPAAPGGAAPQGGAPGGENPLDQAAGEEGAEGEEPGEEGEGEEGEGDMTAGNDEEAKSALDSVIDMMKADAKAKQAEAEARAAEARAKEAEWTAKAAAAKVKQEEEVLDMETHEKQQKEMDKEAKRLAKLAKYRHDKANKYRDELGGVDDSDESSEEEEEGGNRFPYDPAHVYGLANTRAKQKKVSLKQLRDMIYAHLRGDEH